MPLITGTAPSRHFVTCAPWSSMAGQVAIPPHAARGAALSTPPPDPPCPALHVSRGECRASPWPKGEGEWRGAPCETARTISGPGRLASPRGAGVTGSGTPVLREGEGELKVKAGVFSVMVHDTRRRGCPGLYDTGPGYTRTGGSEIPEGPCSPGIVEVKLNTGLVRAEDTDCVNDHGFPLNRVATVDPKLMAAENCLHGSSPFW